jgi:protein involved in ribonucleotide reduction
MGIRYKNILKIINETEEVLTFDTSQNATFAGLIKDGSLEFGNGFWRNNNVVSKDFTVPTGEIWKSLTGVNVNTDVNVTVNGTWTLTNYFGET